MSAPGQSRHRSGGIAKYAASQLASRKTGSRLTWILPTPHHRPPAALAVPAPEPAHPTTVTVSPATAELIALGGTAQLTAEVRDQNGNAMARATAIWSTSAPRLAT